MYKEGVVCFKGSAAPCNLLDFRSELPEVMMVYNTGIIAFKSAEAQLTINEPMVYTAVMDRDSNVDEVAASLVPFSLARVCGVRKALSLFASAIFDRYISKTWEALERSC